MHELAESEKPRIPRHYIENALNYLTSLQYELEGGLTEKAFVSNLYLNEKFDAFSDMMTSILSDYYSEWVQGQTPPLEQLAKQAEAD